MTTLLAKEGVVDVAASLTELPQDGHMFRRACVGGAKMN